MLFECMGMMTAYTCLGHYPIEETLCGTGQPAENEWGKGQLLKFDLPMWLICFLF
jgi:hypothetical protein